MSVNRLRNLTKQNASSQKNAWLVKSESGADGGATNRNETKRFGEEGIDSNANVPLTAPSSPFDINHIVPHFSFASTHAMANAFTPEKSATRQDA